jgi:hypothetical protein
MLASPFKSKSRLEAENAMRGRVRLTNNDRWLLIQLHRWFPSILQVVTIVQPETLVRWHRAGFRCCWRWKSRSLGGRPQIDTDLRALIRQMSIENPLWGAPRIHGELLKLGFEVAQSSVAKYMVKRRGPPSQGWRTFLRNHTPDIAAMDLFVVPTIGFNLLYAFVIVRLDRRSDVIGDFQAPYGVVLVEGTTWPRCLPTPSKAARMPAWMARGDANSRDAANLCS